MQGHAENATSRDAAPEYLECLQALGCELHHAMETLGQNALSSFEESVSRQLALCSRLTGLAARHRSRLGELDEVQPPRADDDELGRRIEDAQHDLVQLNRTYSALLSRTRRTVQMFVGIAQGYAGYGQSRGHGSANLRTWSSQV